MKIYLFLKYVIAIFIFTQLAGCGFFATTQSDVTFSYIDGWQCKNLDVPKVRKLQGPEDIAIDYNNKIAYISSTKIRDSSSTKSGEPGGIFQLNLQGEKKLVQLKIPDEFDHIKLNHPHGISYFQDKNKGLGHLFVIDHGEDDIDSVYIFTIEGNKITSINPIRVPELNLRLNDLVATSSNTFYATNNEDRFFRSMLFGSSEIVYFNGENYRPSYSEGLFFANGIEYHPTKKRVYVTTTGKGELFTFEETSTGKLEQIYPSFKLGSSLDNIHWTSEKHEEFLITGHNSKYRFMTAAIGFYSPSSIYKLKVDDTGKPLKDKIGKYKLDDEEKLLSASSVAALFDNTLLIGSVYQKGKLAVCKISSPD